VENHSIFRIASLSKAVTSASILTLIQDGTLTLEDKMVDHIQHLMPNTIEGCDYPNHPEDFSLQDVTISQLLNHRGGWNVSSDPTYWHWNTWHSRNDPCIDKDGLNQNYDHGNSAPLPMEMVLREWLRHPLNYEPGTQYVYSNIGYQILGQIIEQKSGMSYEAYAQEHVLAPMGITSMQIGMTMPNQRAAGEVLYYDYENDTSLCHFPSDVDDQGNPIFETAEDPYCGGFVIEEKDGGGGWISSASDYAKFIANLDGTLTSSAFNDSFDYFIGNPSAPAMGGYYGRGVYIASTDTEVWNHNGAFSGSSTSFKRDVTDSGESVITVLLTNTRPSSWKEVDGKSWQSDRYSVIGNMMDVNYTNVTVIEDTEEPEEEVDDGSVNTAPRISMWAGKVNQHNENGTWMTDPDGRSGGHSSQDYPNDYGDRKVEYCQKFWPTSAQIQLQDYQETITFYTEGNQDAYTSTKDVYLCLNADGSEPGFDPVDNPPVDPDTQDDGLPATPDEGVDDDSGYGDYTPGFGITSVLLMLAGTAIISRRRIQD
jgi:CubicO group peptidase (beta-lactamase class C family)